MEKTKPAGESPSGLPSNSALGAIGYFEPDSYMARRREKLNRIAQEKRDLEKEKDKEWEKKRQDRIDQEEKKREKNRKKRSAAKSKNKPNKKTKTEKEEEDSGEELETNKGEMDGIQSIEEHRDAESTGQAKEDNTTTATSTGNEKQTEQRAS